MRYAPTVFGIFQRHIVKMVLVFPLILSILVHALILVYPPIPSILVQIHVLSKTKSPRFKAGAIVFILWHPEGE